MTTQDDARAIDSVSSTREPVEPCTQSFDWSVVTVTYNSAEDIRAMWDHGQALGRVEWIVVDNASNDDSAEAARTAGASRVISLPKNVGFGSANNVGLGVARGRYVLFANPDLAVDYDDLASLADHIDEIGGLVAPQLLNLDGTPQPNGRGFPTIWNKIGNHLRRDEHSEYRLWAGITERRPVCFAIGAALAGARAEFDRLGGWDESFFVYYEDSDICMREWLTGGRVTVVGDVRWVHRWARETASFRWKPWKLELASMRRFYTRYPSLLGPLCIAKRTYPVIQACLAIRREESHGPTG